MNRVLDAPPARRDSESGFTVHGKRFDDPYAWLERLDDPETQEWIAAQEAITQGVLHAAAGRDGLYATVARCARPGTGPTGHNPRPARPGKRAWRPSA